MPPNALSFAFYHAARIVAEVMAGQSLAEGSVGRVAAVARPAVQDMVYGVLRAYGEGDALLAPLLRNRPYPQIRALLLCAVYRLATWTDAHTVVDQAVEAAAKMEKGRYKGLVNAVLRNFLRRRESLYAGLTAADRWKHPAWWVEKLQTAYPDAWRDMVEVGNQPPPMSLRVNVRQTTVADYLEALQTAGMAATASGECGVTLAQPVPVERLPGFAEGKVSVQDIGAQRAAILLAPAAGSRVLDACAAPGGKTAHLLERCDLDLTAQELHPARCQQIRHNLKRLRLSARVLQGDACRPDAKVIGEGFDAILADAPCSASGVARRLPDSKWLRRPEDIARFARQQAKMLKSLWTALRPGGKLLYATCSLFPEENGEQIRRFLAQTPNARLSGEEQWRPDARHDGFYYALMVSED
ncbi:MAG: 16S rRNA (cytosine(967)-C(5))-methyltransferase RsmB [Zoogloeaceae bacterium]|jgi:16S rRNA (cytosine967-C5)-methyltransferase|nr:16S rRNA (cytosine(967)-C(5))-methyltransferase RsmB [Zoogloeaceae bacterium]